jgi:hypothetical protein
MGCGTSVAGGAVWLLPDETAMVAAGPATTFSEYFNTEVPLAVAAMVTVPAFVEAVYDTLA